MPKRSPAYLNLSLKNIKGEMWKDLPGFSDYYQMSNYGRAKALERWLERASIKGDLLLMERILKQTIKRNLNPYTKKYNAQLSVSLCKDARKTAISPGRMVYYLFVEKFNINDSKLTVIAKDGDKLNMYYRNLMLTSKSVVEKKHIENTKKESHLKQYRNTTMMGTGSKHTRRLKKLPQKPE